MSPDVVDCLILQFRFRLNNFKNLTRVYDNCFHFSIGSIKTITISASMALYHNTITSKVYSCIRDFDYKAAIETLQSVLLDVPRTRPLLSLLAYCFFHNEEYPKAAEVYEELFELCPSCEQYQFYYIQSLVSAGSFTDATQVAASLVAVPNSSPFYHRIKLLQAQAQAEQNQLSEAAATLAQCDKDDVDTLLSMAGIYFRNNDYTSALEKYNNARMIDERPDIAYCIALCYYNLEEHDMALQTVDNTAGEEDDLILLLEIRNLKAAIHHALKDKKAARATMTKLVELVEEEDFYDATTVHNDAIINFDSDPTGAIQKLLSNDTSSSEMVYNILVMYLNQGHDNHAVETFETYKHVIQGQIPHETYTYLQAAINVITSPNASLEITVAEQAKRLKSEMKRLGSYHTSTKRATTASIRPSSCRPNSSRPMSRRQPIHTHQDFVRATKEVEAGVDQFVKLLMLQAKVYWDKGEYANTEKFLQQSSEILHDNVVFNENLAHALFVQEKFEDSIPYYEMLINSHTDASNLLELPAIALANLCVAYVMTNRNEEAEAIMKAIEREEEDVMTLNEDAHDKYYHNVILNLAVGTLYCEKRNYEFGIKRICKSLEPLDKNLSVDTWFYTKRCFLSLAKKVSKLMFFMTDTMHREIIDFLRHVEGNGVNIVLEEHISAEKMTLTDETPITTVASEARKLRQIFITLSM